MKETREIAKYRTSLGSAGEMSGHLDFYLRSTQWNKGEQDQRKQRHRRNQLKIYDISEDLCSRLVKNRKMSDDLWENFDDDRCTRMDADKDGLAVSAGDCTSHRVPSGHYPSPIHSNTLISDPVLSRSRPRLSFGAQGSLSEMNLSSTQSPSTSWINSRNTWIHRPIRDDVKRRRLGTAVVARRYRPGSAEASQRK